MAFCANCGAQATGSFCPNCGSPITGGASGSATGTASSGSTYSSSYTAAPPIGTAGGLTTNVASALCYSLSFITGIIFLVLAPYNQNKTVRFHAFQSIFWTVAYFALSVGLSILAVITHGLGLFLYPVLSLTMFVLWLYLMYTAYNGKKVKLPVIGDLAEKQA